jgi:hypothetical protein
MRTKVALLFSGGRDSSLAACLLARQGTEVHLLNCDNSVTFGRNLFRIRYRELERAYPTCFVMPPSASTAGLFRRIALSTIEDDFARYKKNLIVLGSQLAMHTEAIVYCRLRGIAVVATGFTHYQRHYAEQMPEAVEMLRTFMANNGLSYELPVASYRHEDEVKYSLLDFGVTTKSLEAVSVFSDTFSVPDAKIVTQYIADKLPICSAYIELKLAKKDNGASQ